MSSGVPTLKEAMQSGKLKFKDWLKAFRPERFEVSFSDIIKGTGHKEYLDPVTFFELTHITPNMEGVLKTCLARTHKADQKGIFHLATGFGGGKSHLLALLYHVFTSRTTPPQQPILQKLSMKAVPEVEIIALDGHNLAYPLSEKSPLKDIMRPTRDEIISAIEDRNLPLLVLIDELVVYLAKLEDEKQREEMANIHTLITAINSTKDSILIITNPEGAAAYSREVEIIKTSLQEVSDTVGDVDSILGRVTQPISPVEVRDFPSVLRKRLVESMDSRLAKAVEKEMNKLTNLDFDGYYPFHHLLVDVLFSRISLFPAFQKTRDALKVVALAVKGLINNTDHADFHVLSPADLLFTDADLKNILTNTNVFGYNLAQAVTKDVIQSAGKADSNVVYGRFSKVASAVFLYSLHPEPEKRGISPTEAHQCIPEVKTSTDMEQLLEKFYSEHSTFLWHERGRYLFKSEQNIPNLIRMKASHVSDHEVITYIKETLFETVFGASSTNQCVFHTPDRFSTRARALNVIVPFYWDDCEAIKSKYLIPTASKKNSLIMMVPDTGMSGPLVHWTKQTLAAEKVKKEVDGTRKLLDEAKKAYKDSEAKVLQQFRGMYTKIWYMHGNDVVDTGFTPLPANVTIRERLIPHLKEPRVQKLVNVDETDPKLYFSILLGSRTAVQVRDLIENVEDVSSIPFAYPGDLKELIKKGVYESVIGLVKGVIPDTLTSDVLLSYGPASVLTDVNDGDTVVSASEVQRTQEVVTELQSQDTSPSTTDSTSATGSQQTLSEPSGAFTASPQEKADSFVADVGDLAKEIQDRMSSILINNLSVRAELSFTGSITGRVTASNLQELQAILELANGLKKASAILGGVKASMTIYTSES